MKIELTTRQILHMIHEGYSKGVKDHHEGKVAHDTGVVNSLADEVAQNILMKHMWENDFHQT